MAGSADGELVQLVVRRCAAYRLDVSSSQRCSSVKDLGEGGVLFLLRFFGALDSSGELRVWVDAVSRFVATCVAVTLSGGRSGQAK